MKTRIIFFLVIVLIYSINVYPQNGWYWQNPTPTGNTLYTIDRYADNKIYAAGYGGVLIYSNDNGSTWNNRTVSEFRYSTINLMRFVDENNGYCLTQDNKFFKTTNGGYNWDSVFTFQNGARYFSFKDVNNGIVNDGNTGVLLKTTDGGYSWNVFSTFFNLPFYLYQISYMSDSLIVLTGYYNSGGSNLVGLAIRSTDNGLSWYSFSAGLRKYFYGVQFIDNRNGVLFGSDSKFYTTTNSGFQWWYYGFILNNPEYRKADVFDSQTCFVLGNQWLQYNEIYTIKTSDKGITWTSKSSIGSYNDFCVAGLNELFAVGARGNILKSNNSGENWTNVNKSVYSGILTTIFSFSDSIQYVGTVNGKILKTTNCGRNWIQLINSATGYITSIHFRDKNNGAITSGTSLLKTTNGGDNWSSLYESEDFLKSVYFLDNNTGFACGEMQKILKTTNSGNNWNEIFIDSIYWNNKIIFINQTTGFLLSLNWTNTRPSVYKTTDRGNSWIGYYGPAEAQDIYFINSNTGFTAGYSGEIYKTTNGGINWTSNNFNTVSVLNSIAFINDNTGYIVGYGPTIMLKTTNTGLNWNMEPTGLHEEDYLLGISSFNGYATFVGYNGIIKSTRIINNVGIKNISLEMPRIYLMSQNYPNPFNSTSNIKYQITTSCIVKIRVFDVLGREVKTLLNEYKQPGIYQLSFNAGELSSGVYYYRLEAGDFSETKKFVLMK